MIHATTNGFCDKALSTQNSQQAPLNTAKKFDSDKPNISLVPSTLILGAAQVMTFGAAKYGTRNYMKSKGDPAYCDRLYSAIQRHLLAYQDGEKIDPESGLSHLHHVTANIAILIDLGAHGDG